MSSLNHSSSSTSATLSTEELNQRNAQECSSNASVIHSNSSTSSSTSTANGTTPIINPPPPDPIINPLSSTTTTTSTPSSSNSVSTSSATSSTSHMNDSDVEMDYAEAGSTQQQQQQQQQPKEGQSNGFTNGFGKHEQHLDPEEEMDVEGNSSRMMCRGNPAAIERMLLLGRELQQMSQSLRREIGKNKQNKTMLQDAFSLLAYNDPWNSPVGWQLDSIQREPVCQALNSAILESHQLPRRPPLEICISHTKQLIDLMSRSGLGACAFASVESILNRDQTSNTSSSSSSSSSSSRSNNSSNNSVCPEEPLASIREQRVTEAEEVGTSSQ
ncbi:UNVERIFIED_CONTAM: hypothetical protein GTU68_067452 [Idotea baltica]|nr:hypothetical protein [Idotea baltica]